MARKTKKQKIIADLRRKVKINEVQLPPSTFYLQKHEEKKETEALQTIEPDTAQTKSLYIYPIQLIKKDLTKTLLLSILAISLEIALFFILRAR